MHASNNKITVFYDGKCGLCCAEIAFYKKRTLPKHIDWIDVTTANINLERLGISQYDLLLHFHVKDNDQIHKGIDAFILLWQHIPGWNWLARLFALTPIKIIASFGYELFARLRFAAYPHCRIVSKNR